MRNFIVVFLIFFSFTIQSNEKINVSDKYTEVLQLNITDNLTTYFPLIKKPGLLIKYLEAELITFSGKHQISYVDNISFNLFRITLSFVDEKFDIYRFKISVPMSENKFYKEYFYIQLDDNVAKIFIPKTLDNFIPQYAIDKTIKKLNYLFNESTQKTIAKNIEVDLKNFSTIDEKMLNLLLINSNYSSSINNRNINARFLTGVYTDYYSTYLLIIFFIILVYYLLKRKNNK